MLIMYPTAIIHAYEKHLTIIHVQDSHALIMVMMFISIHMINRHNIDTT